MKQHLDHCPFRQQVILDLGPGPSPSCVCGPCDHPPERRRPGVWPAGTTDTFCDFCKTPVADEGERCDPKSEPDRDVTTHTCARCGQLYDPSLHHACLDGSTARSILSSALTGTRPYDQAGAAIKKLADHGYSIVPTPCRHSIYHHGCPSCDRQDPEDHRVSPPPGEPDEERADRCLSVGEAIGGGPLFCSRPLGHLGAHGNAEGTNWTERFPTPPGEPDEADKIAGGGGGSRKSSDPLPCRTCGGKGCEYGCGQCDHFPTTHGPNAHRQCVSCLGSGIEPDGEPDEGER